MKKCLNCGGPNPNKEIYCDFCGSLLPSTKINPVVKYLQEIVKKCRDGSHIKLQKLSKKFSPFCIFHIWWKFISFFFTYLFILIPSAVLVYWIFNTKYFQDFFTEFNISNIISGFQNTTLNSDTLQNSLFGKLIHLQGLTDIALLIGGIIAYCAFFEYIKNHNIFESNQPSEYAKILNFFSYAFFASICYDCIIFGGYLEKWINPVSNDHNIEIFFLAVIMLIAIINVIIVFKIQSKEAKSYESLIKVSTFLEDIKFSPDFQNLSIYVFFLTISLPFFGDLLSFNLLSIITIDLQLLYLIATLGIINSMPRKATIIQFKQEPPIPDAFLLRDHDENYIIILTSDNKKKKVMKDSILWTAINENIPINKDNVTQIGDNIYEKPNGCLNLTKIKWWFLLYISAISILIEILMKITSILLPVIPSIIGKIAIILLLVVLPLILLVGIPTYDLIEQETVTTKIRRYIVSKLHL